MCVGGAVVLKLCWERGRGSSGFRTIFDIFCPVSGILYCLLMYCTS